MLDNIIPNHIGYIVDGNRRWAKERNLPTYEGHLTGHQAFRDVITASFDAGVKYVSAYIFSTENWKRSEAEVGKLISLIFKLLTTELFVFKKNNIKLVILGSKENLSDSMIKAINNAEAKTAKNTSGTLALCFNYSGQQEIVDAVKKIVQTNTLVEDIDAKLIEQNLYRPEIPSIDLVVRTSGEQRISNFMLWRIAYSEMIFVEKYWPDMTKDDVKDIIKEYSSRSRRFGS